MKKVLIVAYAFPPMGVAGSLRPLGFVKYLPRYGWQPIVLTIRKRPDIFQDNDLLSEIPPGTHVHRTRIWDPWVWKRSWDKKLGQMKATKAPRDKTSGAIQNGNFLNPSIAQRFKHLINDLISTPDHQITWLPSAIAAGIRLFSKFKYDAILTTSPPVSSHLIGLVLSRLTRRPWLADFRDPWLDNPLYDAAWKSALRKRIERRLEEIVLTRAAFVICNTRINRERLARRYSILPSDKFKVIPNGFDKELIDSLAPRVFPKTTITHTGIFYPHLDPYFFFDVLSRWIHGKQNDSPMLDRLQVLLVGSREDSLRKMIEDLNLRSHVHFIERVTHKEALAIAKGADAQLVSLGFDEQAVGWVPLKLYDYLGCGRPILAFLPEGGEAAGIIASTQAGKVIASPDEQQVLKFLDQLCGLNGETNAELSDHPTNCAIEKHDQKSLVKVLAETLDRIVLQ